MTHRYREVKTPAGKRQFELRLMGKVFMILPVEMALSWDPSYRRYIEHYDENRAAFRRDAAAAWKKHTELGCANLVPES